MTDHELSNINETAAEELRRQHQDAASVRLDRDETTDDICRELRAAGLDPERMQRRVREIIDRVAAERRAR
jgi:ABC-type ATPase involved in cell division